MNSNEVMREARSMRISNFLGVFAADQLGAIDNDQVGTLIVNTDPFHLPGQHCFLIKKIYIYMILCYLTSTNLICFEIFLLA